MARMGQGGSAEGLGRGKAVDRLIWAGASWGLRFACGRSPPVLEGQSIGLPCPSTGDSR